MGYADVRVPTCLRGEQRLTFRAGGPGDGIKVLTGKGKPMTSTLRMGLRSRIQASGYAAIVVGCTFIWACLPAWAQADFSEDFDSLSPTGFGMAGPPDTLSRGWLFRNQSNPLGDSGYYAGPCESCGEAHAGAHTLAADFSSTDGSGGTVSNWALLPAIAKQTAGDALVVHARAVMSFNVPPRLQVRY